MTFCFISVPLASLLSLRVSAPGGCSPSLVPALGCAWDPFGVPCSGGGILEQVRLIYIYIYICASLLRMCCGAPCRTVPIRGAVRGGVREGNT